MTPQYIAEHKPAALRALHLAEQQAGHLQYTAHTLYAEPIDPAWVAQLASAEHWTEKIDAFVSRFARLQDHLGDKVLPAFARLLGAQPKSLLDVLAYAERMGWVASAERFIAARRLRNLLIHEYVSDPAVFLEALHEGKDASAMLFEIIAALRTEARQRGLQEEGL